MSVETAMSFRLDGVTNQMLIDTRTRYARLAEQRKVEVVSFRCNEDLLNKIQDHASQFEGLSTSVLVSDLVALGLTVFNNLQD